MTGCVSTSKKNRPIETTDADYKEMTATQQSDYIQTYACLKKMSETPYLVHFDNGKATIPNKYHKTLDKVANCLKAHKNVMLVVEGYSSQIGNPHYNAMLSEKRAAIVKNALVKRGVEFHRINAYGLGTTVKHIPKNWDGTIDAYNRRVNITPYSGL